MNVTVWTKTKREMPSGVSSDEWAFDDVEEPRIINGAPLDTSLAAMRMLAIEAFRAQGGAEPKLRLACFALEEVVCWKRRPDIPEDYANTPGRLVRTGAPVSPVMGSAVYWELATDEIRVEGDAPERFIECVVRQLVRFFERYKNGTNLDEHLGRAVARSSEIGTIVKRIGGIEVAIGRHHGRHVREADLMEQLHNGLAARIGSLERKAAALKAKR